MADLRQIALSVAQDLMTLEVNTVLKPGMTARKPPAYPLLLREIAEKYVATLVQLDAGPAPIPGNPTADTVHIDAVHADDDSVAAVHIDAVLQDAGAPAEPPSPPPPAPEHDTVIGQQLAEIAKTFPAFPDLAASKEHLADAIDALHPPADAAAFERPCQPEQSKADCANASVWKNLFKACAKAATILLERTPAESPARAPLRRIARESLWLVAFLDWQHPEKKLGRGFDLQPEDRMRLRKLWNLGGERVVMQTTIHLDGDVLNGIDPALLLHPQFEAVKALHADGVGTALTHWRALFEAICTAFGKLGDAFSNVLDKRRG